MIVLIPIAALTLGTIAAFAIVAYSFDKYLDDNW
jgi:hypothetical protein